MMIGGHELNFDVNEDKLPREVVCKFGETTKTIKLTWNMEVEDTISLLVTLLMSPLKSNWKQADEAGHGDAE